MEGWSFFLCSLQELISPFGMGVLSKVGCYSNPGSSSAARWSGTCDLCQFTHSHILAHFFRSISDPLFQLNQMDFPSSFWISQQRTHSGPSSHAFPCAVHSRKILHIEDSSTSSNKRCPPHLDPGHISLLNKISQNEERGKNEEIQLATHFQRNTIQKA